MPNVKYLHFALLILTLNFTLKMNVLSISFILISLCYESYAIWCYQCPPAMPGCNTPFNWRGMGYLGNPCPDAEDVCVKLIERKGAKEVITRDCLSNFKSFRMDIPADTYEGCRSAAKHDNLANYVNNSIKELDIKRDWYDETIWCFCFLDHRCNGASTVSQSITLLCFLNMLLIGKKMFF